ncbi:MAG: HesA/MoeB/ThiF family protein [Chloroflexota bacterium]
MLTEKELERYDRQIIMPGFGREGQEKLKKARAFIAGVGGLGSPLAIYLAAAGVGMIRIVDQDIVSLSNLNRQVLHWQEDIDRPKIASAQEKLGRLNPDIKIEAIRETITENNVHQFADDCDLIVDAMDNMEARYLLTKTALKLKIPFFHGAVWGFEGRAMTVIPGESACLGCLYRGMTRKEKFPVIGAVPAVIACIQATEVIKYIVGIGDLLTNRLLTYDGLSMKFMEFGVRRNPECRFCGDTQNQGV